MEVKREPLRDVSDLRIRQHKARDLLRGDMDDEELERYAATGTEELLPDSSDLATANINVFKPGDTAGA